MKPDTDTGAGPSHILIGDISIPLSWQVSKRAKRLSVRLDLRTGGYRVTLPIGGTITDALRFLNSKSDWLLNGLSDLAPARPFSHGTTIPFLGEPHTISHRPDARRGVWQDGDVIYVSGKADHLARRLTDWLRSEAKRRLTELAREKSANLGKPIGRVTVRDTTSRWGSCSSTGNLSFSWRMVLAPLYVQDYLAAHEVAHLVHRNHGPKFWQAVDELTTHRFDAQAWLKMEGPGLLRIGLSS